MAFLSAEADASLRFLLRAGNVLSESLDYEVTLKNVAKVCVPFLGDWCVIDLYDRGRDEIKRVVIFHANVEKAHLAAELQKRVPPDRKDSEVGPRKVIRTGRSELLPRIDFQELKQSVVNTEHLDLMKKMGIRSSLSVPLIVRNNVIGTLTFVSGESGRTYADADLPMAEELANICALHIENARLYWELDRGIELRDHILGVVSHDLRNPLSAIKLAADLLLKDPKTAMSETDSRSHSTHSPSYESAVIDRTHRIAKMVKQAAESLAQLITDIVSLRARREDSEGVEQQVPLNLNRLIERSLRVLDELARKRRIRVFFDSELEDDILLEPRRTQIVISLMLENTIFSLQPGGEIHVSAHSEMNSALVEISGKGQRSELFPRALGVIAAERVIHSQRGELERQELDDGILFRLRVPCKSEQSSESILRSA